MSRSVAEFMDLIAPELEAQVDEMIETCPELAPHRARILSELVRATRLANESLRAAERKPPDACARNLFEV